VGFSAKTKADVGAQLRPAKASVRMTVPAESAANNPRPLRILEIGANELFAFAVPEQTEFYWTGTKPRGRARRAFGPLRLFASVKRLRRGEFDLLVVHASQYAPWHPRSVLTTLRDWNVRASLGLFGLFAWRCVHLFHDVPMAVVDLGDSSRIGRHNFFLLDRCTAFFKRELPSDNWLAFAKSGYPNFPGRRWRSDEQNRRRVAKLKPISLGHMAPAEVTAAPEKSVDVFFAGETDANSTIRAAGIAELRALEKQGYAVDIAAERLDRPEYLRRMSAAWLAWSPAGLGWDCYRHYEAPLAGSVPLMNYPPIERYRPLRDGEHCVLYPVEACGLIEAARTALADKPRLRKMAAAAAEHVRTHHSFHARAEHVTSTVLGRRLDGSRMAPSGEPSGAGVTSERYSRPLPTAAPPIHLGAAE
jgi:Glycosyl transferases group 1